MPLTMLTTVRISTYRRSLSEMVETVSKTIVVCRRRSAASVLRRQAEASISIMSVKKNTRTNSAGTDQSNRICEATGSRTRRTQLLFRSSLCGSGRPCASPITESVPLVLQLIEVLRRPAHHR